MSKNLQQVMTEALQFHQQGQLGEAEKRYRLVLQYSPDFPPALHYLGVIGLQTGHLDAAIPLLQRANNLAPNDPAIQSNLGTALLQNGEFEEAEKVLLLAAKGSAKNPQVLANLGNAQQQLLKYEHAISSYRNALAIESNLPEVKRNLASCYVAQFDVENALTYIEQAVAALPNSQEVLTTYGNILLKADRPEEAIDVYLSLLKQLANSAPVETNLALAYAAINQNELAIEHAKRATSQSPEFIDGWINYAAILQEQGNFSEAETVIRQAQKIAPHNASLLSLLTRGKKFEADDDKDFVAMKSVKEKGNLTPNESIRLNYALGKAYENLGQFELAFNHFTQANQEAKSTVRYQVESDIQSMRNIVANFTQSTLGKLRKLAPESHLPDDFRPIFIVGMPRSGSTLTEQILSSHSNVSGAGELPYLARQIANLVGIQNSMDCTANLAKIDANIIRQLRQNYFDYIQKLNLDTPCFTDKMLMNFLHIGLINVLFPDSPIVHCQRDPLDTCLSIYKLDFSRNGHHYANDQDDLARFYLQYQELMSHWDKVLTSKIHHLTYESLVADQEKESKALTAFCGLDWEAQCLEFHHSQRRVSTLSVAQVRQPIYKSSVKGYTKYEKYLGPMIKRLKESP